MFDSPNTMHPRSVDKYPTKATALPARHMAKELPSFPPVCTAPTLCCVASHQQRSKYALHPGRGKALALTGRICKKAESAESHRGHDPLLREGRRSTKGEQPGGNLESQLGTATASARIASSIVQSKLIGNLGAIGGLLAFVYFWFGYFDAQIRH